jgi:hypothetical protein
MSDELLSGAGELRDDMLDFLDDIEDEPDISQATAGTNSAAASQEQPEEEEELEEEEEAGVVPPVVGTAAARTPLMGITARSPASGGSNKAQSPTMGASTTVVEGSLAADAPIKAKQRQRKAPATGAATRKDGSSAVTAGVDGEPMHSSKFARTAPLQLQEEEAANKARSVSGREGKCGVEVAARLSSTAACFCLSLGNGTLSFPVPTVIVWNYMRRLICPQLAYAPCC